MSVKSDSWIRKMANEYKMIEPFEPAQVKKNGEEQLISYGTTSYGYDVRCSDAVSYTHLTLPTIYTV